MKKKKRVTQKSKIKKYLESGNSITPHDALRMFGCFRLASTIHSLRKHYREKGFYRIETTMIKNEYGVEFAKYYLVNKGAVIIERGKDYIYIAEKVIDVKNKNIINNL